MTLDPWWKPTRPVADRSLVITGTSTDVGKTIVTAALAATLAAAGTDVAVCKPAQTGVGPDEPGDLATVTALAGDLPTWEGARFPDPLAPETAAHRAGSPQLDINDVVPRVAAGDNSLLVHRTSPPKAVMFASRFHAFPDTPLAVSMRSSFPNTAQNARLATAAHRYSLSSSTDDKPGGSHPDTASRRRFITFSLRPPRMQGDTTSSMMAPTSSHSTCA